MTKFTKDILEDCEKNELISIVMGLQEQINALEEKFAISQANRFGKSSEKYIDAEEMTFNEIEAVAANTEKPQDSPEAQEEAVKAYIRKKAKGKRDEDLKNFPVTVINHELTEEELKEKFGEAGYKRLPDEVYRKLERIPATYEVLEHHIAVYASKKDDTIVKAKRPTELLNNSIATPSLVASIMNAKYTNALPLYRIEQEFKRNEINISRQTMANWVIACSGRYLSMLYDRMHEILKTHKILQADETTVTVSKTSDKDRKKCYMWVYRTGEYEEREKIVLFNYEETRNAQHPEEFLKGFTGTLECDGYAGYHKLGTVNPDIKIANCWAHARRSFVNAVKASKAPQGPVFDISVAAEALKKMQKIYDADGELKKFIPSARKKRRQKDIKPLVDAFFAWIKERIDDVPKNSSTGKGIRYCINQEPYLRFFLEDGNTPIDNSAAERAIRPFTVGRKNFVMIDTILGAEASGVIYSIVETAKANNLKPYEYLKYLLTEIPKHLDELQSEANFLDDLLPWSPNLPEICKMKEIENKDNSQKNEDNE